MGKLKAAFRGRFHRRQGGLPLWRYWVLGFLPSPLRTKNRDKKRGSTRVSCTASMGTFGAVFVTQTRRGVSPLCVFACGAYGGFPGGRRICDVMRSGEMHGSLSASGCGCLSYQTCRRHHTISKSSCEIGRAHV